MSQAKLLEPEKETELSELEKTIELVKNSLRQLRSDWCEKRITANEARLAGNTLWDKTWYLLRELNNSFVEEPYEGRIRQAYQKVYGFGVHLRYFIGSYRGRPTISKEEADSLILHGSTQT